MKKPYVLPTLLSLVYGEFRKLKVVNNVPKLKIGQEIKVTERITFFWKHPVLIISSSYGSYDGGYYFNEVSKNDASNPIFPVYCVVYWIKKSFSNHFPVYIMQYILLLHDDRDLKYILNKNSSWYFISCLLFHLKGSLSEIKGNNNGNTSNYCYFSNAGLLHSLVGVELGLG